MFTLSYSLQKFMNSMNSNLVTVQDFEKLAASKVSTAHYDFFAEGSIGGQTVKDNIEAFRRWYHLV